MAKYTGHIDWFVMLSASGLMLFSLAFVYSASSAFAAAKFGSEETLFWNHALRIFSGLIVVIVFSRIDYRRWSRYSQFFLLSAQALLALALVVGQDVKGASRWLHIGPLNFQPSELAKFALALHLSSLLSQKNYAALSFREGLFPLLAWSGLTCTLIALQPNFSTASAIFLMGGVLMFVGGANIRHILQSGAVAAVVGGLYAVSAPYRLRRILAFLNWGDSAETTNYQLKQALIAFGSGGFFGVGPGQSVQREFFLPESYGDFIFSVVGEEYGFFLGVLPVMAAFGIIVWRGLNIAKNAPDAFGKLLATGIVFALGLYAFINAGVNCGILPTTGLPMPFISYGGTSVLFSAAAVGILLNISAQSNVYPRKN